MKPIRIAIYSGTIPSTTFIERLIVGLAEQGFEVVLFGAQVAPIQYSSSNIRIVGNRRSVMGVIQTVFRIFQLKFRERSKFKKLRSHLGFGPFSSRSGFGVWQKYSPVILFMPDIFHLQWAKAVGDWVFLKELFGVKLVLSLRGAHINYSPLADEGLANMYRNSFPKFDAFHAVSKAIAVEAELYGASPKKSFVIYSGLKQTEFLTTHQGGTDTLRILAVGRFHWKKGYHYLLTALAILKSKQQAIHLTLIAQGEMPEEILFQLHDLNLTGDVKWIKGLPHNEVVAKMKRHDVLVLTSVEEGIANVVLEAMGLGLPVISTDCGGMKEVIQNGENGFLVPVRNPEALAAAMIIMAELSTEKMDRIRKNAHQTIQQHFNIERSIKDFESMYQSVLS